VGLPFAFSLLAIAACNALTGASDLVPCDSCDGDSSSPVVVDASVDGPVGNDALGDVRESSTTFDASTEASTDAEAGVGIGCAGAAACERVVFVTSLAYTGDLGGIAGADAKCQSSADASTSSRIKGRTFVAWVSTPTNAVSARLTHGTMPYVRPDGEAIATEWNTLVDGALDNGIAVDELGDTHNTGNAWTGTNSSGATSAQFACMSWTSFAGTYPGERGNVGGNGSGWSGSGLGACDSTHRLYCFER
jgi:hypothetical protein